MIRFKIWSFLAKCFQTKWLYDKLNKLEKEMANER